VVGNQPYDARVESASGALVNHIEVTLALDGPPGLQERLRTEHLEEYGRAPVTTRLDRDPGSRRVREARPEMVEHDVARDAELEQISVAARRKAAKTYPQKTVLIVEFRSTQFRVSVISRWLRSAHAQSSLKSARSSPRSRSWRKPVVGGARGGDES
jgi:hypothetical protein